MLSLSSVLHEREQTLVLLGFSWRLGQLKPVAIGGIWDMGQWSMEIEAPLTPIRQLLQEEAPTQFSVNR